MQYKEFSERISDKLRGRFGEGYCFIPAEIPENNGGTRHSLIISSRTSDSSPCICMDGFFNEYLHGCSEDTIADEIESLYESSAGEQFDVSEFSVWEAARTKLYCRLVNSEKNRNTLFEMPHRELLDLSMVYYVRLRSSGGVTGSVRVRNEHMEHWGVDEEALYRAAMGNMQDEDEVKFENMDELLAQFLDIDLESGMDFRKKCPMFVLGSKSWKDGAAQICNQDMMAGIAEFFRDDYWILPSSTHEVILVPAGRFGGDAEELAAMVKEVNDTQLAPEDILSYHVYRYRRLNGEIVIAA